MSESTSRSTLDEIRTRYDRARLLMTLGSVGVVAAWIWCSWAHGHPALRRCCRDGESPTAAIVLLIGSFVMGAIGGSWRAGARKNLAREHRRVLRDQDPDTLVAACPGCGAPFRVTERFCPGCGRSRAASRQAGRIERERRRRLGD